MDTYSEPSAGNSPNKRTKTLTPADEAPLQSTVSFISKGKYKIEEETLLPILKENEIESSDCCGICLSQAGTGVSRGYIESCSHYFCFVCIMEWAKVESKCPLCKRRFSTIRRPAKPPLFTSERLVHVPVRDQVYHYFGNATIGPPDLYSEVKCSLCHSAAHESLLLLCDLCDSAAHTYCVGLGVTVPEGDWFCQDCTLLRDEHLKSENNTDSGTQINFDSVHKISSTHGPVSVSDIVQAPCSHAVQRSRSASSGNNETSVINNVNRLCARRMEAATQHLTMPNARTLQHCRGLHDRIRVLRENWNGFRSGSLHFPSCQGGGSISNKKSVTCVSEQRPLCCLNLQSAAQCGSSGLTDNPAHEIHKAWKMMDKAKSVKQGHQRPSIRQQAAKCHIRKRGALINADHRKTRHLPSKSQKDGSKDVQSTEPVQRDHHYLEKNSYKLSPLSGKLKFRSKMTSAVVISCEGSIIGRSQPYQELGSSKSGLTPSYMCNASARSVEALSHERSLERAACLSSSTIKEPLALNADNVKKVSHSSSSHNKLNYAKEKNKLEKIYEDDQQYCDAKSEIQSLVKLYLRLQMKDEKLGVDAFKEAARLATHSILAACGLEHPKPGSYSFPGVICSHPIEIRQLQKSSLMPDSCRECFYAFVKSMVDKVMLQKKSTSKKTW